MSSALIPAGLYEAIEACLLAREPELKLALTAAVAERVAAGERPSDLAHRILPLAVPGRPERPELVAPRELKQRKLSSPQGRAALVHAVAHIEFNAINLAWDAAYRFRHAGFDYLRDWASVAADEARHFALLQQRLQDLGWTYGDFPAHNGLWETAVATAGDFVARMALVPRVLEARGLDVTPGMIERLRAVGDEATVAALEVILAEELRHVAVGDRWYRWACAAAGLDAEAHFRRLVEGQFRSLRGPFNAPARLAAGFSPAELTWLLEQDRAAA
ncbi:MAG: ferritin-like domain-containing protein [Xanthomonadales bacterium]|nr:ferritin-like domain-containing protein [Xanthomonadales bacterium]